MEDLIRLKQARIEALEKERVELLNEVEFLKATIEVERQHLINT